MASAAAEKIPRADEAQAAIEIKIKTLDSQTYTLKVDKQTPVPALKEQIASVTGVLTEQQRLICRGRVLKDDQLLSAYHVEDGHTLHLVVRQPVPPSAEGFSNTQADPASIPSRTHSGPSIVIEAFSMPDQRDGVPPEISRIVSAVLGSFGLSSLGSGAEGADATWDQALERMSSAGATLEVNQQGGTRGQSDRPQSSFGLAGAAASLGSVHPPVIPDALTTLTQYLSHIQREFNQIGRSGENNAQTDDTRRSEQRDLNSSSATGNVDGRLPTPAALAEVMLSSRQLLIEQVSESLLQLGRQLNTQESITDSPARLTAQTTAWRTGVQLHNLGAFLLELGRTTMTLRLGQAPSEAVVNTGPAVFINSTSPNPLMVQPLPFQPGASLGASPMGSVQPGSGFVSGVGTGFIPRRIDIQIRRAGSSAANNEEGSETPQQQPGQRNAGSGGASTENTGNQTASRVVEGSLAGETGVRVVPIRTVVAAAVPASFGRIPSDSSGNSLGMYYPLLGRFQQAGSGTGTGTAEQRSRTHGNHQSASTQTEQQPSPDIPPQSQGTDATPPTPEVRSTTRSISINILSAAGGARANQESEGQVPSSIMQLLRSLFPVGEIHVEGASGPGATTPPPPAAAAAPQNAGPSADSEQGSESAPTNEGIFLSNLLRQILPVVSEQGGSEAGDGYQGELGSSEDQVENNEVGTSRRRNDSCPSSPSSKRQKIKKTAPGASSPGGVKVILRENKLLINHGGTGLSLFISLLPHVIRRYTQRNSLINFLFGLSFLLQTEKAFLKQPNVFLSSKKTGKGKRPGKGGNRYHKSIGLGFKTPREAIEGTYIDKKCPFTGNVSIRGRILAGTCHSAKMMRTIIVRRNYLHFVKKYQRYEKRHSNIAAHVSPCFRVKEGDHVIVGQCRPLSKTVRFNVLKVIPAGSSGGGKKAFTGM
ncbi:Ubiquitin-like domain-containing protein CIP73 [Linum grandiflorum]